MGLEAAFPALSEYQVCTLKVAPSLNSVFLELLKSTQPMPIIGNR